MADETSVLNFGCRLNAYEGEAIRGLLDRLGRDDVVVVNTCAVTAEAEKQARQAIRRLRRERPDARIVVTGCAAQVNAAGFAAMAEVDHVIGNREKLGEDAWRGIGRDAPRVSVGDIQTDTPPALPAVSHFPGRPRAYLEIQQGCDHRCTFCVIPFGRGPSRSVPIGVIVEQVRALVQAGYREVVLTGVDITSYGPDLPGRPSLGQMVRRLLALVPELPRLRLSSIDPVEVDDDLWRLIAEEPRLMPHLHLSLQHGADLILKRMKRRHLRADAIALADRARRLRPDMVFGADLIAGFPTETEAHFAETLSLVEACNLSFLHVFPYSERPDTPAARMPQLPVPVRRDRAARLRAAGAEAAARLFTARIGQEEDVLFEHPDRGHTRHFAPLRLARGTALPGEIRRLRVTAAAPDTLLAEAA